MKKIIEKTIKTTAASFAVVFLLLCISGCCNGASIQADKSGNQDAVLKQERSDEAPAKRRRRRRAEDYSRLPSNMPANWQIKTVGY